MRRALCASAVVFLAAIAPASLLALPADSPDEAKPETPVVVPDAVIAELAAPAPEAEAPKPADAPKPAEAPKPKPATSGLQLKAGDANIKFGVMLQPQADWSQTAAGGYVQNMFLRRVRLLAAGQISKDFYFFFQTENSRLGAAQGTAAKVISTGFQVQDAVLEWRIAKEFNIWGGLIYVPTSREALKSSSTEFMLDVSSYAYTATTALAGTGGRDTGFMARGYFNCDRLEYRLGAFQGIRESGSRNPFRTIGRLQYNFLDTEVYNLPAYPGSYFGSKKILALGGAFDLQKDYQGYTADLFADLPIPSGSLVGDLIFQSLDGGATVSSLPKSQIFTADAGLYFKGPKLGPWARYEQRSYSGSNSSKDEKRWLAGLNIYVAGNNFNIKLGYGRVNPTTGNSTNQFTIQLQAYYF